MAASAGTRRWRCWSNWPMPSLRGVWQAVTPCRSARPDDTECICGALGAPQMHCSAAAADALDLAIELAVFLGHPAHRILFRLLGLRQIARTRLAVADRRLRRGRGRPA